MIFNSKSKNVVGELSQKMLLNCSEIYVFNCFLYKFSESHCNDNRSFWPRRGHFDMGCFSLSRERALFTFQSDFFTKLNTCPSVHSYTYNNAYTYNYHFQTLPKQPKTEMTHSENWPK